MKVMELQLHLFVMILGWRVKCLFCPELFGVLVAAHHWQGLVQYHDCSTRFVFFFVLRSSWNATDSTCIRLLKWSGCWTHISQEEENWAWTFVVHSTQSANRWVLSCPSPLGYWTHKHSKPLDRITLQLKK